MLKMVLVFGHGQGKLFRIAKSLFGNGIVPALGEGITAQNAPNGQNQSDEKTPFLKCFDRIGRAGWRKPAARRFQGRDILSVKADEPYHNMLHNGENICSEARAERRCSSISVLFIATAALLAAITIRKPTFSGLFFSTARSPSRRMRRTRCWKDGRCAKRCGA